MPSACIRVHPRFPTPSKQDPRHPRDPRLPFEQPEGLRGRPVEPQRVAVPARAAYSPSPRAMIARWMSDVPEYSRLPTASRSSRSTPYSVVNP